MSLVWPLLLRSATGVVKVKSSLPCVGVTLHMLAGFGRLGFGLVAVNVVRVAVGTGRLGTGEACTAV